MGFLGPKQKFEKYTFSTNRAKFLKWIQWIINTLTLLPLYGLCFKENQTFLSQLWRVWRNFESTSFLETGNSNYRADCTFVRCVIVLKCAGWHNLKTVQKKPFILCYFTTWLPPTRTRLSKHSIHRWEATAKSSLVVVLMTPSQLLLKVPCVNIMSASSDFTLEIRKKSAGARSGKKGEWGIVFNPFPVRSSTTEAADCTGALSRCTTPERTW